MAYRLNQNFSCSRWSMAFINLTPSLFLPPICERIQCLLDSHIKSRPHTIEFIGFKKQVTKLRYN